MGGGSSQMESSVQKTKNQLLQISSASCSNDFVSTISGLTIDIENVVTKGSINIDANKQFVYNTSCVISNTLDSSIQNSQKADQDSENSQDSAILAEALLGAKYNQSQADFQSVSNDLSQILSSNCQNKIITRTTQTTIIVEGAIVGGDINITVNDQRDNNLKCNLSNVARAQVKNDQSSTQTEKLEGTLSVLEHAAIILALIGLLIVGVRAWQATHGKLKKSKQDAANKKTSSKPAAAPAKPKPAKPTAAKPVASKPAASKPAASKPTAAKVKSPLKIYKSPSFNSPGFNFMRGQTMLRKFI